MTKEPIESRVRAFVLEVIESVEQLEILLLLAADESRSWNAEEIAKELRSSPRSAARWLASMTQRGLLQEQGDQRYVFHPANDERREDVLALGRTYATRRVSIIDLIFNRPTARLQTFADAFKLREKK